MRQKKEANTCNTKRKSFALSEMEKAFRLSTVILRGSRGATVYGCRKILHYSPTRISLQIRKDVLTVCGSGLYCTSFSAGTVSLEGEIAQVCFEGTYEGKDGRTPFSEEEV